MKNNTTEAKKDIRHYKWYAFEHSDGKQFLVVEEPNIPVLFVSDGSELIFSGCPQPLFFERMTSVSIGETFKYRRKTFKRIDPMPFEGLSEAKGKIFVG